MYCPYDKTTNRFTGVTYDSLDDNIINWATSMNFGIVVAEDIIESEDMETGEIVGRLLTEEELSSDESANYVEEKTKFKDNDFSKLSTGEKDELLYMLCKEHGYL